MATAEATTRPGAVRRRGLAVAVAGLVAGAGLSVVPASPATAAAHPGMTVAPMPFGAVSLAQAGQVAMWGPLDDEPDYGQATVPAALADVAVTQVHAAYQVTLAVTAAGKVVSWGANEARLERLPAAVTSTPIAQVTSSAGENRWAGAVTRDGRVLTWGTKVAAASPLDVPAGLTGVTQLAMATANAIALKHDGTVLTWGSTNPQYGGDLLNSPPPGLRATAIAAGGSAAYALTTDGTVVAWGANVNGELDLPAEVTQQGNVKAVAAAGGGALALLADNTLVGWGGVIVPAWASASAPAAIVGSGEYFGAVDEDGVLHQWKPCCAELAIPSELNGRPVAHFAVRAGVGAVVITKMLRGEDPGISGSSVVGSTLTATPGTFSASPESVTSQWLANGAPIPGASGATLALTDALVGKQITYQSTATKTGETTISSTSAPVTVTAKVVPPPPPAPPVPSTTKVLKVQVAKKAASVTVTGKVTAAKAVAGKATVTIKKGKKTIIAKAVTVPVSGAVKLVVKKFGKLAIKKTKSKKKNGYKGAYTATIAYAGSATVKASSNTKKFKVK